MSKHRLGNHSQSHTIIYHLECRHLESAEKRNPLYYCTPISLLLLLPVLKVDEGED